MRQQFFKTVIVKRRMNRTNVEIISMILENEDQEIAQQQDGTKCAEPRAAVELTGNGQMIRRPRPARIAAEGHGRRRTHPHHLASANRFNRFLNRFSSAARIR